MFVAYPRLIDNILYKQLCVSCKLLTMAFSVIDIFNYLEWVIGFQPYWFTTETINFAIKIEMMSHQPRLFIFYRVLVIDTNLQYPHESFLYITFDFVPEKMST